MFCPGGRELKSMRLSEDSPRAPFWLVGGERWAEEVLPPAGVWEDDLEPASVWATEPELLTPLCGLFHLLFFLHHIAGCIASLACGRVWKFLHCFRAPRMQLNSQSRECNAISSIVCKPQLSRTVFYNADSRVLTVYLWNVVPCVARLYLRDAIKLRRLMVPQILKIARSHTSKEEWLLALQALHLHASS